MSFKLNEKRESFEGPPTKYQKVMPAGIQSQLCEQKDG